MGRQGAAVVDFMNLLELTDERAELLVDAFIECVDFGALLVQEMQADPSFPEIPEEKLQYVGTALEDSEQFREGLKLEMLGQDSSSQMSSEMVEDSFDQCGISFGDLLGS